MDSLLSHMGPDAWVLYKINSIISLFETEESEPTMLNDWTRQQFILDLDSKTNWIK